MKEFGSTAIARPEFTLSPEERLRFSLEQPNAKHAMTMRAATAITKARIAYNLSEISNELLDEVKGWIRQVGNENPRAGVLLFLDLLEFTQSRQHETTANVNSTTDTRPAKEMTVAELEAHMKNLKVVSTQ